jgi:hypothetical protein
MSLYDTVSYGTVGVVPPTPSPAPVVGHRVVELLLVATPTVAFLVADAVTGALVPSAVAAVVAAAAVVGWRSYRREPLRKAVPGLVIVAVCAAVAAVTGQARGFFLVPTLVPFVVMLVCLASVAAGRPLTGVVLNRLSGGPPDWYRVPRLRRVHVVATLVCVAVNVVNAIVQVVFYRADEPVVLGIAHIATGPVFATIVAVTLVFARRAITADAATPDSATRSDAAGPGW